MQTSYKAFELADYPTSEFVGSVPKSKWNKYKFTLKDFIKEAVEKKENLEKSLNDFAREGKDLALEKYPEEYRSIWGKIDDQPTNPGKHMSEMLTSAWETMDDVDDKALRAIFALRWYVVLVTINHLTKQIDDNVIFLIKSVINPDSQAGSYSLEYDDMEKAIDDLIGQMDNI